MEHSFPSPVYKDGMIFCKVKCHHCGVSAVVYKYKNTITYYDDNGRELNHVPICGGDINHSTKANGRHKFKKDGDSTFGNQPMICSCGLKMIIYANGSRVYISKEGTKQASVPYKCTIERLVDHTPKRSYRVRTTKPLVRKSASHTVHVSDDRLVDAYVTILLFNNGLSELGMSRSKELMSSDDYQRLSPQINHKLKMMSDTTVDNKLKGRLCYIHTHEGRDYLSLCDDETGIYTVLTTNRTNSALIPTHSIQYNKTNCVEKSINESEQLVLY